MKRYRVKIANRFPESFTIEAESDAQAAWKISQLLQPGEVLLYVHAEEGEERAQLNALVDEACKAREGGMS